MASTFNIGGGPRSKKNLVSDCPGGCTVTLSGPWTTCTTLYKTRQQAKRQSDLIHVIVCTAATASRSESAVLSTASTVRGFPTFTGTQQNSRPSDQYTFLASARPFTPRIAEINNNDSNHGPSIAKNQISIDLRTLVFSFNQ